MQLSKEGMLTNGKMANVINNKEYQNNSQQKGNNVSDSN